MEKYRDRDSLSTHRALTQPNEELPAFFIRFPKRQIKQLENGRKRLFKGTDSSALI